MPQSILPESALFDEIYRWDQRVFGIVLKPQGQGTRDLDSASPALLSICEKTGGWCQSLSLYKETSREPYKDSIREINIVVDRIFKSLQHGVVLNFEVYPSPLSRPPTDKSCLHRVASIVPQPYNWPLPDNFIPDRSMPTVPRRTSQPYIKVVPESKPGIQNLEMLGCDRYEIEPCPSSHDSARPCIICALKNAEDDPCWQVYLPLQVPCGDMRDKPFGYLRMNGKRTHAILHVLPYNYPRLQTIFEKYSAQLRKTQTPEFRSEFDKYLAYCPPYYMAHMQKFFKKQGYTIQVRQPDFFGPWHAYIKRIQMQPIMMETPPPPRPPPSLVGGTFSLASAAMVQQKQASHGFRSQLTVGKHFQKDEDLQNSGLVSPTIQGAKQALTTSRVIYKNPFDIPRSELLNQIELMKKAAKGQDKKDKDARFCVPIAEMGRYEEAMKKQSYLREPLMEPEEYQLAMRPGFGNPYSRDRGQRGESSKAPKVDMDVNDEIVNESEQAIMGVRGRGFRKKRPRATAIYPSSPSAPPSPSMQSPSLTPPVSPPISPPPSHQQSSEQSNTFQTLAAASFESEETIGNGTLQTKSSDEPSFFSPPLKYMHDQTSPLQSDMSDVGSDGGIDFSDAELSDGRSHIAISESSFATILLRRAQDVAPNQDIVDGRLRIPIAITRPEVNRTRAALFAEIRKPNSDPEIILRLLRDLESENIDTKNNIFASVWDLIRLLRKKSLANTLTRKLCIADG
eukprot:TRINITY_DN8750_c0_g1_i3.p1 TRINITY_DN8750_c0_g1~~TRINITY_DN8750_c0_g1_i3.p1  ORF type:complete len:737 (-),score=130.23 TRINITY_DN8750_c0_g1_i3:119-2329(-)